MPPSAQILQFPSVNRRLNEKSIVSNRLNQGRMHMAHWLREIANQIEADQGPYPVGVTVVISGTGECEVLTEGYKDRRQCLGFAGNALSVVAKNGDSLSSSRIHLAYPLTNDSYETPLKKEAQ